MTLVHTDAPPFQASLSQVHDSTLLRAGLVVSPELVVGVSVTHGLSVELRMGYRHDVGLGGWRTVVGRAFGDAPIEGLHGFRRRGTLIDVLLVLPG